MSSKGLRCDEKKCSHFKGEGCGFAWIEQPEPPPRGSMSRDYCPMFIDKDGEDIQVSMSAYN